ncbi:longitudinals lacking protein, isoforms A/B/D/L-like, partial [Sipha flava]|uniref:Longitudinals lacking protein, isoforms A/B/D/L-like n=1 Tax=Sipha flava TaxID=143950 RepID=A0A8B8GDT8_9HEMI
KIIIQFFSYSFYKLITTASDLIDVLLNNILRNSRHLCPNDCGRHYKRIGHMNYHLKYECGVSPQFKCPYCSKLFSQKSTMKKH